MLTKYPGTLVSLTVLLLTGLLIVLLAPVVHADPAQVLILLGVIAVGIPQIIQMIVAESNGHRLTAVEKQAQVLTDAADATSNGPTEVK